MNLKNNIYILVLAMAIFVASCSSDPEHPGSEYMPDMGHSIAYEANVYTDYYYNTWEEASVNNGSGKTLLELSSPRKPVNGTIARGYAGGAGHASDNGVTVNPNGSVPYYYTDTEEERTRAMNEIINSPFPITEAALANGKEMYVIFCATCHGDKADGNGYLARDESEGGKYLAQPANLINEEFTAATNGRFYHALIYGKNLMGGYGDKISYEERWNVIHYIRSLQAKETGTRYDHMVNTLNTAATPGGNKPPVAHMMEEADEEEGHGHDDDADHGEEGDHSGDDHDSHDDHGHDH